MNWYFQSCLADNNGKSREIWISLKKINQQMLSEIQLIKTQSREEQNLKTISQIRLEIRQILLQK